MYNKQWFVVNSSTQINKSMMVNRIAFQMIKMTEASTMGMNLLSVMEV
jgi:hypothetical protein